MRLIIFVFVAALTLTFSVSAQTPLTVRAFGKGTQAAQANEFKTALEKYRQALLLAETERSSDDLLARIHFNIGVCLFNLQQPDKAAEEYTEAIKLSRRTYQKAFYALGMARREMKNWRKAQTAFKKAVALDKSDGEAWFDLGLVLIETEDFDSAEKAFKFAIKYKSRETADAHNNLGVIRALKNDFFAAETEFETALIESNGKSVEAINNLQFCRIYKRDFNRNLMAKLEFTKNRINTRGE